MEEPETNSWAQFLDDVTFAVDEVYYSANAARLRHKVTTDIVDGMAQRSLKSRSGWWSNKKHLSPFQRDLGYVSDSIREETLRTRTSFWHLQKQIRRREMHHPNSTSMSFSHLCSQLASSPDYLITERFRETRHMLAKEYHPLLKHLLDRPLMYLDIKGIASLQAWKILERKLTSRVFDHFKILEITYLGVQKRPYDAFPVSEGTHAGRLLFSEECDMLQFYDYHHIINQGRNRPCGYTLPYHESIAHVFDGDGDDLAQWKLELLGFQIRWKGDLAYIGDAERHMINYCHKAGNLIYLDVDLDHRVARVAFGSSESSKKAELVLKACGYEIESLTSEITPNLDKIRLRRSLSEGVSPDASVQSLANLTENDSDDDATWHTVTRHQPKKYSSRKNVAGPGKRRTSMVLGREKKGLMESKLIDLSRKVTSPTL